MLGAAEQRGLASTLRLHDELENALAALDEEFRQHAEKLLAARLLMTIPGVNVVVVVALAAANGNVGGSAPLRKGRLRTSGRRRA